MTFMLGESRFLSRMFSGLRSQWIILARFKTESASRICDENVRTRLIERPATHETSRRLHNKNLCSYSV